MVKSVFLLCLWVGQAEAATIESVRQDIDQFKQQAMAEYAPMTLARAEAYLGAGMLAKDSHNVDDLNQALQRSEATLTEAQASATRFQQQFSLLILQRQKIEKILAVLPKQPAAHEGISLSSMMDDALLTFKKVVRASELGHLNESRNKAEDGKQAFQSLEKEALPQLEDAIQRMLSKAAMKGAKRYAPVTYTKAKTGLNFLKAYLDQKPIGSAKPEDPLQTYIWAKQALSIANNVKTWRSDRGSYEMLLLRNQHARHRLAKALKLKLDVNYSTEDLVKAVQKNNAKFQQNRTQAQHILISSKLECEQDKQQALKQLQTSLLQEKNIQLTDMKDAFRAKLERETFEIKRQKRLRALFPEKSVQIIVHLDGSLLVRLSILQFASGRTKLDAKYYDLLGRLKNAMELYGDRNFRIEGHTDSLGDGKENQQLSLQRAESVRDFLIAAGVDATSIKALGYGEVRPIASNEFAKGREMNRRIDVVIEARGE